MRQPKKRSPRSFPMSRSEHRFRRSASPQWQQHTDPRFLRQRSKGETPAPPRLARAGAGWQGKGKSAPCWKGKTRESSWYLCRGKKPLFFYTKYSKPVLQEGIRAEETYSGGLFSSKLYESEFVYLPDKLNVLICPI